MTEQSLWSAQSLQSSEGIQVILSIKETEQSILLEETCYNLSSELRLYLGKDLREKRE